MAKFQLSGNGAFEIEWESTTRLGPILGAPDKGRRRREPRLGDVHLQPAEAPGVSGLDVGCWCRSPTFHLKGAPATRRPSRADGTCLTLKKLASWRLSVADGVQSRSRFAATRHHSRATAEPDGDAFRGSVQRLGHPTRRSVERCRRQTNQRDRGAWLIRRSSTGSRSSCPVGRGQRHPCGVSTGSGAARRPHPRAFAGASQDSDEDPCRTTALSKKGRPRVRVAPVVHAPGQAGATYQPREGARLLVRRGAAAGRM